MPTPLLRGPTLSRRSAPSKRLAADGERLAELGARAAQDMTRFTWAATARPFLELLGSD